MNDLRQPLSMTQEVRVAYYGVNFTRRDEIINAINVLVDFINTNNVLGYKLKIKDLEGNKIKELKEIREKLITTLSKKVKYTFN